MVKYINIGEMIQNELDKIDHSPAWLAKQLHTCRTNGYKIINEKKFNDVISLIDISIAVNHNFFHDLAEITDIELSKN
ncbi:MAG: XRE family transcriptional regulator [Bacteroidales bacterium]|nr:XRE family transcriptional regulator [Bacteroidales bacterium]